MKADSDRKAKKGLRMGLRRFDYSASVKREVRDNFFPSFPSTALANHFIKYPLSEGNTFTPLFFAKNDTSVESKQAISHCIMNVFPPEAIARMQSVSLKLCEFP